MRFRAEIEAILDPRKFPIEWVEAEIAAGRIALMENDSAVIAVERRAYPGGYQELHGMFAAGSLEGVLELVDQAVEAARVAGMDAAAIASRPAWEKILKSRGFSPHQVILVKELR